MGGHRIPLLLDFPDSFETERLLIRAPRPGDSEVMQPAIDESLENLSPWMPWAVGGQPLEETEAYVRRSAASFIRREALPMLLFRQTDGLFVGGSGLHSIDWSVPVVEIGYWVRASLQGQGYVTEAVRGISRFAFTYLDAERIEIRCDSRNTRSAATARRSGFTLEATLRHEARAVDGSLRDTLVFALLKDEWEDSNER